MYNSEEIKKKIKEKGYFRVIIRPSNLFYKNNYFELQNIEKIIKDTKISLRGWSVPYITSQGVDIVGDDRVSSCVDFQGFVEYWEFSKSGQFSSIFGVREDYIIGEEKTKEIKSRYGVDNEQVNSFLEVVNSIYLLTEIYLFASNLAQLEEFNDVDEFEIIIELNGVKNRMLYTWDIFRDLWNAYICKYEENKMQFSNKYKKNDLISNSDQLAFNILKDLFIKFRWTDVNEQMIKDEQRKLLTRKL